MLVKSKVKYIQSLGQKKFRQSEGLFLAEGPKLVTELLQEVPQLVQEVFATADWMEENGGLLKQLNCMPVNEAMLEKISLLSTPNKVVALVKQFEEASNIDLKNQIVLALDGIQDPGNLGTIIRIADWFNVRQIVCSLDTAELYNPKVVQSTMGSIARVGVVYKNLAEWLPAAKKEVCIYATALDGINVASDKKINEGVIIIGNESKGVNPILLQMANVKLNINRKGKAESLNAAVATGIILSHLTTA